jgi:hypothetical protein
VSNSTKIFTDQAEKVQVTWKQAVEKQMEMNREALKNFSELFKKAA